VVTALARWADAVLTADPEVRRIGYFGSYARGDWGVGSDLDVLMLVARSSEPFERRAARWDTTGLPVPVDLLVYTTEEWERLGREGRRLDRRAALTWLEPPGHPSGEA
jgi:predicted nucleotidyltransferase